MANAFDDLDSPAPASAPNAFDDLDATHPVAGPSGSSLTDWSRRLGTSAANFLGAAVSMPRTAAEAVDWAGRHIPSISGFGGPYNIGSDKWLSSFRDPSIVYDSQTQATEAKKQGLAEQHDTEGNTYYTDAQGNITAPDLSRVIAPPAFLDAKQGREQAFSTLGATEYQPQTYLGRRTQDVLDMAPYAVQGVARGAWKGGAGLLSRLAAGATEGAKELPALAAAGAGGGAGAEALPDHPVLGGLVGMTLGSRLGNAAITIPQRLSNIGEMSSPYDAFSRLGLPTDLSGTVTGNKSLKKAEGFAAKVPGGEDTMAARKEELLNAWQDKYNKIADELGGPGTPAELGASLQKHSQDWLDHFNADKTSAWNNFDALMPPNTHVDVSNFRDALDKNLSKYPGAPATGDVLQAGTMKNLKAALDSDLNGGTTLPFGTIQAMRTAIGERISNPQLVADTSHAAWKNLYKGLSGDMSAGAQKVSPEALQAFKDATDMTKIGHDTLEQYLGPILNAESPEKAGTYVMQNARLGPDRLRNIVQNLPEDAGRDIQSYMIRNLAGAPGLPSPSKLVTNLQRPTLYSNEVKDMMLPKVENAQGGMDLHGQNMADLLATAKILGPMEKELANPRSGHSANIPFYNVVEGARMGHELANSIGGHALSPLGLVLGGVGGLFAPSMMGKAGALPLGPRVSSMYGREVPYTPPKINLDRKSMFLSTLPGAAGESPDASEISTMTVRPQQ